MVIFDNSVLVISGCISKRLRKGVNEQSLAHVQQNIVALKIMESSQEKLSVRVIFW